MAATNQGVATFEKLPPGRYAITAEFDGFDPRIIPEVRVRAGDNNATIVLAIRKIADTVTVARGRQEAAVDRTTTFGSALTRERIDALSDDPEMLRQQLQEMAGGPAIIRVDSLRPDVALLQPSDVRRRSAPHRRHHGPHVLARPDFQVGPVLSSAG